MFGSFAASFLFVPDISSKVWCCFVHIYKSSGSSSRKAQCTLVEANGDLLVHDPINKWNADSRLGSYKLLCIYLSNSPSSNQSVTVSLQVEGYKRVTVSQFQVTWGDVLDTKLGARWENCQRQCDAKPQIPPWWRRKLVSSVLSVVCHDLTLHWLVPAGMYHLQLQETKIKVSMEILYIPTEDFIYERLSEEVYYVL